MYCMIPTILHSGKDKTMKKAKKKKKKLVISKVGWEGGINGPSTEEFYISKTLCMKP